MVVIIIFAALFVFWIQYLIAKQFYIIAQAKGYPQLKYLWLPFFLGPIGYLLVVALPDHSGFALTIKQPSASKPQENTARTVPAPETKKSTVSNSSVKPDANSSSVVPSGMIRCPVCDGLQSAGRRVCWHCGVKFDEVSKD